MAQTIDELLEIARAAESCHHEDFEKFRASFRPAAVIALLERLKEAEQDQLQAARWSTDAPPMNRDTMIEVRRVDVYRWLPYKPDGARQMKKAGRWQRHDGYGFTNAELPEGVEWRALSPHPSEEA